MKKLITIGLLLCATAFSQTPPLPIGFKPKGAGKPVKAAQRQVEITTAAKQPATLVAAVVVPAKMLRLIWIDDRNPPGTTYNVYSTLSVTTPMSYRTNTVDKFYIFPADKPMEFFQVKALRNGLESGWGSSAR